MITAVIKTFLRDEYLFECVKSIHDILKIPIIVADDGFPSVKKTEFMEYYNVDYNILPFNSGWSIGRNFLLDKVKTPYFLQCDDDFYFNEKINIDVFIRLLEHENASIITGRTIEKEPRSYEANFYRGKNYIECKPIVKDNFLTFENINYLRCQIGLQFFIGKSNIITRWDENIHDSNEHVDFFLSLAKNKELVLYSDDLFTIHKPVWINQGINEYEEIREKRESYDDYFFNKKKSSILFYQMTV